MLAARNAGIEIRLGCSIAAIDESRPAAVLSNGEDIEADLIVGADGIAILLRTKTERLLMLYYSQGLTL
jgi:2-polyprenyl-6-methoxyphenol hydroxylase-like FAD-dependent oxidoreductase